MLKTILTRHVSAEFTVNENGQEVLVKSVAVNFDADGGLHILGADANQRYCGQILWVY